MIDVVKRIEPEIGYGPILKLSEAEAAMRTPRIRRTKTVCTYCGVGCSFDVWTKDRHILKVEPAEGPANGISTCVKGKFAWDYVTSVDRLTTPLIREGNGFRTATWDEALDLVARQLSQVKASSGPDAIGLIASSKCTNEESYLMQKLARAVIGTNNVDNCSRYCQAPATMGLFRTVGYGGDSGSIADIEQAALVLIIGSNTAESHPVLATRVKQAHKLRGQELIVADRREHEMARRADVFLCTNAGTDLVWLSAISRYLLDNGLAHTAFLEQWVNGLEAYRQSLAPFTLEMAARVCGLSVETLKQVATGSRRPTASASSGRWASRNTSTAPIRRPRSPICCCSPATTCDRAPARTPCAGTTMCRERATTAPCPTCSRLPARRRPRGAGALRSGLAGRAAHHQRARQPRDGRRDSRGKAQGHLPRRRGNGHR